MQMGPSGLSLLSQVTRCMNAHRLVDIPAINIVDDFPTTPPMITRDITSPYQTPLHRSMDSDRSVIISPGVLQSPDMSFGTEIPTRPLQRRQRTSDVSMLSIDMGR